MKQNLPWRNEYWSKKKFLEDTICVLNDKLKLNYVLIPKCGATTIRTLVFKSYREKLFKDLTEDEISYKKFIFVRDVDDRFYSALNTILKRMNSKQKQLKTAIDNNKLLEYLTQNNDPHLMPQSHYIKNMNIDYIFDLNLLLVIHKQKANVSTKGTHENSKKSKIIIDKIKETNITEKEEFKIVLF